MSKLWKWVNERDFTNEGKVRAFLFLNCLKYSVLGLLAWLIVSRFILNSWDWALCFVLYPGFFVGYIGGFICILYSERKY